MPAVRADTADDRGAVDDEVGPIFEQPRAHGDGIAQVELIAARREERLRPPAGDTLAYDAAEEAVPPRQQHAAIRPEVVHARVRSSASSAAKARSESTMRCTSSSNDVAGVQPSFSFAFDASPSSWSTSVGRR